MLVDQDDGVTGVTCSASEAVLNVTNKLDFGITMWLQYKW